MIDNTTLQDDTIVAISTPHGVGGIAVIRVSGKDAVRFVGRCWQGKSIEDMKSHTAHFGRIADASGEVLDEVVLTVFKTPHSFTGEDVIEISCHGSLWIQQQIVNLLIDDGCRAASGGEFTRRAFANGKLDLSQAEAVADIIASSSRASHRVAMNQMRGVFSQRIGELRQQLLQFVSLIELELDFSEEDVTFADREKLLSLADKIHGVIKRLAESYATGNVIKNGLPVAIVGQTNAGKSTILNALLHDDKALVSDIQGTTRDVIEDTIVIGGITFRFIDTAGIRHSSDAIEAMGIERTFRKLDQAQIVLWVIDGTEKPQDVAQFLADNIEPHCHGKQLLAVINKADVAPADNIAAITKVIGQRNHIVISAKREADIAMLQQRVTEAAAIPQIDDNAVVVTNARHYEALVRADEALARSITGLKSGLSGDLVSQDIRECLHYLGEITGEISNNEILGEIFSHFCVGK